MKLLFFSLFLLDLFLFNAFEFDNVFNFNAKNCDAKLIQSVGSSSSISLSISSSFSPSLSTAISLNFINNGISNYGVEEIERNTLYDSFILSKKPLCQDYGGLTLYDTFYPTSSSGFLRNGIASSSLLFSNEEVIQNLTVQVNYQPCFTCLHEQVIFKMSIDGDSSDHEIIFSQFSVDSTHVSYKLYLKSFFFNYVYKVPLINVNENIYLFFILLIISIFFSMITLRHIKLFFTLIFRVNSF